MKELSNNEIGLIKDFFSKTSFHESVVIRLQFIPGDASYILDCIRVNWELAKGKREFCRICFEGVSFFRYTEGISKVFKFSPYEFITRADSYTLEIDEIEFCQSDNGKNLVRIILPVSFGSIEFQFDLVTVLKRVGDGNMVAENEWEYRDEKTKQVFDFFNPFHKC